MVSVAEAMLPFSSTTPADETAIPLTGFAVSVMTVATSVGSGGDLFQAGYCWLGFGIVGEVHHGKGDLCTAYVERNYGSVHLLILTASLPCQGL